MSRCKVMVDDNFDYMDQDKRYVYGVFLTAEEAISACKHIVDSNLDHFMPGMTASEHQYRTTGSPHSPARTQPRSECPATVRSASLW